MKSKLTEEQKETMKEEIRIIAKILDRADKELAAMGYENIDRYTALTDIQNAHRVFNLDLDRMLVADQSDFFHDFLGIKNNIDRSTRPVTNFNGFTPRLTK